MEEFNKALQDKKFVDAANQLERVRAAYIISTQALNLGWEIKLVKGWWKGEVKGGLVKR